MESAAGRLLDLLVETSDLREILATAAELAVDTVPGCESASVTVIYDREPATVASSDERAQAVDEAQYRDETGPCLKAAKSDDVVQVDDVRSADFPGSWKRIALDSGINATLSIPIASSSNIAAGLNLYTTRASGWSDEALESADLLAAYTGDAITLAYRLNGSTQDLGDPQAPAGKILPFG
jgi:GAF domain-containing protein